MLVVFGVGMVVLGLWVAIATAVRSPASGEVAGDRWPPMRQGPWWKRQPLSHIGLPPPGGGDRAAAWRRLRRSSIHAGIVPVIGGLALLAVELVV